MVASRFSASVTRRSLRCRTATTSSFDIPVIMTLHLWRDLESLAQRIADGFAIANGILHIEFLVSQDTRIVYLIEFAIRGCGSKVATHLMPALTGVDVVRVVIRQAFGLPVEIEPSRARHGALHFLMFPRGRVVAVRGIEEARRLPGVIDDVRRTCAWRVDP